MPFGRRKKKPIISVIKNALIYLISFSRTRKLISVSLKRLKGSPYELAIGLSSGIAVSFTPFIGLHALFALSLAWILRGSMAAALIGTLFGNPWTFPFLWYFSFELGQFFYENLSLNLSLGKINFSELKQEVTILVLLLKNIFVSTNISEIKNNFNSLKLIPVMAVGSIPLSFISWFISYFILVKVFKSYNERISKRRKNNASRC